MSAEHDSVPPLRPPRPFWQPNSVQSELLGAFFLITLFLSIGIGSISYIYAQRALRDEAFAGIEALRKTRGEELLRWFRDRQREVQLLSANPTVAISAASIVSSLASGANPAQTSQERLKEIARLYRQKPDLQDAGDGSVYSAIHNRIHPFYRSILATQAYADILILSPAGEVVYSTQKHDDFATDVREGAPGPLRSVFQDMARGTRAGVVAFTDMVLYAPAREPVIFFAAPILGEDGVAATLVLELPISTLNDILSLREGLGETGESYVVGSDLLFRSESRFTRDLGVTTSILNKDCPVDTQASRAASHHHTGMSVIDGYLGRPVVSTWQPVVLRQPSPEQPDGIVWSLVVEKTQSEVEAPIKSLLASVLGTSAAASLLALGLAYVISRHISTRVRVLTEGAHRVGAGELGHRIDVRGRDELTTLAEAFNSMSLRLQQLNAELDQLVQERSHQLEVTQRELVRTAHRAGMAEVAANVLHNVGNVITSVRCSISILREEKTFRSVEILEKLTQRLSEPEGQLAELHSSPQGRFVANLLVELVARQKEEQRRLRSELERVSSLIVHISHVMSLQQRHATGERFLESLLLQEIIEDAFSVVLAEQSHQKFEIRREYAPLAAVSIDRHRLLQILVNLISNARHALAATHAHPRLLTVRLEQLDPDHVRIEVEDNGKGIDPEHFNRLFRFGFSTRPGGHGFGLHSSAVAAKELGGTLTARSEGQDKGATFTLVLPISPLAEQRHLQQRRVDEEPTPETMDEPLRSGSAAGSD